MSLDHVVCYHGKSFLECFRQSKLWKDLGTIALYHGRTDEESLKSSVLGKAFLFPGPQCRDSHASVGF